MIITGDGSDGKPSDIVSDIRTPVRAADSLGCTKEAHNFGFVCTSLEIY
jgi:hypothetical protein